MFRENSQQPLRFNFYHENCLFLDAKNFLKVDSFYSILTEIPIIQEKYPQLINHFWLPEQFTCPMFWNKCSIPWPPINEWLCDEDEEVIRMSKDLYVRNLLQTGELCHSVSQEIVKQMENHNQMLAAACLYFLENGAKLEQGVFENVKPILQKKRSGKSGKYLYFKHMFKKCTLTGLSYEIFTRHVLPNFELYPLKNPNGLHR